jgi:hypothetical protein
MIHYRALFEELLGRADEAEPGAAGPPSAGTASAGTPSAGHAVIAPPAPRTAPDGAAPSGPGHLRTSHGEVES